MPVEIAIALSAPEIPVLGTLEIRVLVRNTGALPIELPGPDDRTDALTIDVTDRATGALVRRMNGLTFQRMLSRARASSRHDLAAVPGGGTLDFTLDLAQYHQPLTAGDYEVRATLVHPPAEVDAASAKVPVRVTDLGVTGVSLTRDNPVLDGATILAEGADGSVWGRLHNVDRPLAAWWNRRLELPPGTRGAFTAAAGFFQTDSFGPFFETWVLFQHGSHVVARCFAWGKPTGEQRAAPLPARGRLVRSAVRTATRDLYVFFWSDGLLEGYRLDAQSLTKVMEAPLPRGLAGEPCVRADEDFLHIVYPYGGLVHAQVGLRGQASTSDRVHKTGLLPVWWLYEPPLRRLRAVFADSRWGRTVELFTSDGNGTSATRMVLPTRGHVTEIDFERSQQGTESVLYSTSRKRLYLMVGSRGPMEMASGQERYFPFVKAGAPLYIGYARPSEGHRFHAISLRPRWPRIIDYETEAWNQP
ncbi:MAG: hypothetical protein U0441_07505 [Polyangiaceae bacterium]